jgi:hypothetical protein
MVLSVLEEASSSLGESFFVASCHSEDVPHVRGASSYQAVLGDFCPAFPDGEGGRWASRLVTTMSADVLSAAAFPAIRDDIYVR